MKDLRTWGALAALVDAASYIFGFVLLLTLLAPSGYGSDGAASVSFLAAHSGLMITWNLAIYVLNGLALALLAVALAGHFRPVAPGLAQAVVTFGALWATLVVGAGMVANVGLTAVVARHANDPTEAAQIWEIVHLVENGLGGGNEIAGGTWALIVGAGALATGLLSRPFGWFSVLIGASGLATIVPGLREAAGALFGLGYIVWFVWVGLALWRHQA